MSNKQYVSSGNTLGLLGVLFVGLKLTGIINWSWWWVTAPFWGGLALLLAVGLLFLLGIGVGAVIVAIASWRKAKRARREADARAAAMTITETPDRASMSGKSGWQNR